MNYPAIPSNQQMTWHFTCVLNGHNPDEIVEFARAVMESDVGSITEGDSDMNIMREIMERSASLSKGVLRDVWAFIDYCTRFRNFHKAVALLGGLGIFTLGVLSLAQFLTTVGTTLALLSAFYIIWELILWDYDIQNWSDTVKAIKKRTGARRKDIEEVVRALLNFHNANKRSLMSKSFRKKIEDQSMDYLGE